MPDTPFFPAWRGRFGHFGRHFRQLRQHSLHQLDLLLAPLLPAGLLSQTDEGLNSRDRVYSVRVTFWAFLWQVLTPGASCRSAVRKVMATPDVIERLRALGTEPGASSPEEFRRMIADELNKWREVAKKSNLRFD